MKIGDAVWYFDLNHRVYRDNRSAPVYREHWRKAYIVGETSRSWLVGFNPKHPPSTAFKLAKNDPTCMLIDRARYRVVISAEAVDADCWASDHRYSIVKMIERCDGETLKKVAELIGYTPEAKS